jgi:hypothetical protein
VKVQSLETQKPKRPHWLRRGFLVAIVVLTVAYFGGHRLAVTHRYPIEIREVPPEGAVTYIPQNFDDWNHEQIASDAWWKGGLFVRKVIYSRGLAFTFTSSGKVLGLLGTENNGPNRCEDSFWWTGDPHAFPFPERWYGAP